MSVPFHFDLLTTDPSSNARAGVLHTAHGDIPTPAFMPVGTQGTVKGITPAQLKEIGPQVILGNTYHLGLRPGDELVARLGGLHRFMGWEGPILTDSGGFQVFSLAELRKMTEEGVTFQSHVDGSPQFLSRRSAGHGDPAEHGLRHLHGASTSAHRGHVSARTRRRAWPDTTRWLARSIAHFNSTEPLYGHEQALFPIVQGSTFAELRKRSSEVIASKGMPGNAIGGLSVGEPEEEMYAMAELCCDILPKDKPRYLMGVGTPWNLLENMARGIDMFDCVMPTRNGRNGMLFTREGVVNIKNKQWADDHGPLDPTGTNWVDATYSRAFVRHLFQSGEMLGQQIASLHNLGFYLALMQEARERVIAGTFSTWKNELLPKLKVRL